MAKIKPIVNAVFKCSYGTSGTPNDFTAELPFEKDNDAKIFNYINLGNTEFGGKILGKSNKKKNKILFFFVLMHQFPYLCQK